MSAYKAAQGQGKPTGSPFAKRPDVGARAQDHLTREPTKHFCLPFGHVPACIVMFGLCDPPQIITFRLLSGPI